MIETIEESTVDNDGDSTKVEVARYVTNSRGLSQTQLRRFAKGEVNFVFDYVAAILTGAGASFFGYDSYELGSEAVEKMQDHTVCDIYGYCEQITGTIDGFDIFLICGFGILALFLALVALGALMVGTANLRIRLARIPDNVKAVATDSIRWTFARHFLETEALRRGINHGSVLSRGSEWLRKSAKLLKFDADVLMDESAGTDRKADIWTVFVEAINGENELGPIIDGSVSQFVLATHEVTKKLEAYPIKVGNTLHLGRAVEEMQEITATELSPIIDFLIQEVYARQELSANHQTQRKLVSTGRRNLITLWR
jgi:hypothetical protein